MVAVAVPVTQIVRAAATLEPTQTTGDATNGHSVANNGHVWIELNNTNGASTDRTATVTPSRKVDGLAPAGRVYTVAPGTTRRVGPFPVESYGESLNLTVSHAEMKLRAWTIDF